MNVEALDVSLPKELEGLDGLVIPGGESTTIGKLMREYGLTRPVRGLAQSGMPILGTCAGMVLLAREVSGGSPDILALMNIKVKRSAFGRQVDSFETGLDMPALGSEAFRAVFIRAPIVEEAGSGVETLARLPDGAVVAARQNNVVVSAFHPELTDDLRFHQYFLSLIASR